MNNQPITDEQKHAAIEATTQILRRIDFQALDELRKRLELPPEALGVVTQIYVSQFVVPGMNPPMIPQRILPMSSKEMIEANVRTTIRGVPKSPVVIAGIIIGGKPEDWIVNDIRIDGETVFEQTGDIPGDMFTMKAIQRFVRPIMFSSCVNALEMDVTYIGIGHAGSRFANFYAAVVGSHAEETGSGVQPDVKINMGNDARPTREP